MELNDIKNFHQSENLDTKQIIQIIIPKLYD